MNEKELENLTNYGISVETINKISNHIIHYLTKDVYKKVLFIHEVFGFAGLSYEQIDILLQQNISILDKDDFEIIKIACVLENTGLADEMFIKSYKKHVLNYKRIFMRDFVIKESGKGAYSKRNSVARFLLEPDYKAYSGVHQFDVYEVIKNQVDSDKELEWLLNKSLMYNGKHITVDECINRLALIFYNKYKEKRCKAKNYDRFI